MAEIFIVADLHLGHRRIIEFERDARSFATIQEHDAEIVRRWNATVGKKDTVWVLGDVLFGLGSFATLAALKGVKKLVMGNHDNYPIDRYREHFSQIYGAAQLHGAILTHIPVHPGQFGRYKLNIHGHLHSGRLDDPRYICVSAEQTGLAPVPMDGILTDRRGSDRRE